MMILTDNILRMMKSGRKLIIFAWILMVMAVNTVQVAASPETRLQNDMILVNGGTFSMGTPATEHARGPYEALPRDVTVNSFHIAKYPVTQADYEEIMRTNPSRFKDSINLPVENVNWFDAIEYCNARSLRENLTPAYTREGNVVTWNRQANGYRLPTEAEWEYACRAGTTTRYHSGTSMDDAGWHGGNSWSQANSRRQTHPVGRKRPNNWGLFDMHGNVLEWCWDWLDFSPTESQTNPTGPATPPVGQRHLRIYRGGNWNQEPSIARSAFRFGGNPNLGFDFLGFRVVRNAE